MLDAICIWVRRRLGLRPSRGVMRQFGAIPYRRGAGGLEVLLITSRRGKRWIFPKGEPMLLRSGPGCAAQEAFEEAGVEGRIGSRPAGSYRTVKPRYDPPLEIEVALYPLEVATEHADWPEKGSRKRRWARPEEAAALVAEPDLAAVIRAFRPGTGGAATG